MSRCLFFNRHPGRWLILLSAFPCLTGPAVAQTNPALAPVLTANVNGESETTLYQGWPLLLSIGWTHPEAYQPSTNVFIIGSPSAPWTNSLQISVTDSAGNPVIWPFRFLRPPGNSVVLSNDDLIDVGLYLPPEQNISFPTNQYTLTVTVDTQTASDPTLWRGIVESVPVQITLLTEPTPLSPKLVAHKAILQAGYWVALGKPDQASSVIDRLLSDQPTNITAFAVRSNLQARQGNLDEAQSSISAALATALSQNADSPEAPIELLRQQHQVLKMMNAPKLTSVQESNAVVTLHWTGQTGARYSVDVSHDLQTWSPVASDLVSTNISHLWSTNAALGSAFYRVRW